MNDRIRKLREESLNSKPYISGERAQLLTEFYRSNDAIGHSMPMERALVFKYLMDHKTVCINKGELIVGERGEAPKATPTYPELTVHTLQDLEILDTREKIPFTASDDLKRLYRDKIIPFWTGRSMRERIFSQMSDEWTSAYEAGIFTEFMEQRAPGHTVLDDKIYRKGFRDLKEEIQIRLAQLDYVGDPLAYDNQETLRAMAVSADALIRFAERYAEQAEKFARKEKDPQRKRELEEIGTICRKVPLKRPETFWEALQYYWFVHLGVITELNTWDSFNPGRLDQHLWPFYQRERAAGTLTRDQARELLQAFWIKFNNQPAPPKVGVTAAESSTYTDFCLINLGGVGEDGGNAVNELSYLILDVIEEMRLLQPSSMVQISKNNPDEFLHRALGIIKTGYGQPSIFNTDAIVQEMLRQGKSLQDARRGGASGCVETGAFGKESYILTGYFNLPKVLEVTLNNGTDPRTGRRVGLQTGDPGIFTTFDDLFCAFRSQIEYFANTKMQGSNVIERLFAQHLPTPFLSLLIDDCIARGLDYHAGGARYNTSYIQGVGIGTVTDALTAIQSHVYSEHRLTLTELTRILRDDFADHEVIRQRFINKTPKYGNDDDRADDIMTRIFEAYYESINGRPNTRGGTYRINMLPTTSHVYFGKMTGATADGRRAEEPLSEGISPVQGADRKGPSAVINSAAKMDHLKTGGTLLNQKFTPQFMEDSEGLNQVLHLVRTYFRLDGHHIQFNVVTAEQLREAQQHPEKYRDLIVRVAGYSDYFVDLSPELQDEIIRRTEHEAV